MAVQVERITLGRLHLAGNCPASDRALDCGATLIITADGSYRRGAVVPLKKNVDDALRSGETPVKRVIVFRRTGADIHIEQGRDPAEVTALRCRIDINDGTNVVMRGDGIAR